MDVSFFTIGNVFDGLTYQETSPEVIVLWLRNLELLLERALLVAIVLLRRISILRRLLLLISVLRLLIAVLGLLIGVLWRLRLVTVLVISLLLLLIIPLIALIGVVIVIGLAHDCASNQAASSRQFDTSTMQMAESSNCYCRRKIWN